MEQNEDDKLRELLREWSVPGAPSSLDTRMLDSRRPVRDAWWRFLLAGSIRIPVPVALALAAILLFMTVALVGRRPAPAQTPSAVSLVDFRPVSDLNVRVIRNHERN